MSGPASKPALACDLEVTFTPLGGAAEPVIEEGHTDRRNSHFLACNIDLTESLGQARAQLVMRNPGGKHNSRASGDGCLIRARAGDGTTWVSLIDGIVGAPVFRAPPGDEHPTITLPVYDWDLLLDLTRLAADRVWASGTQWRTIADNLVTENLTGISRDIDADTTAITNPLTLKKGTNLKQALDEVRVAWGGQAGKLFESTLRKSGATKTYKLFQRSSTIQRTLTLRDILEPAERDAGDVRDVVNDITILGATVPSVIVDKTGLARAGAVRIDTTTIRVAQPFVADDTPLYRHLTRADRSVQNAPPTLKGWVARNSVNKDVLGEGLIHKTPHTRTSGHVTGTALNANDGSDSTTITTTLPNDNTFYELFMWDLASAKDVHAIYFNFEKSDAGQPNAVSWEIQWSNNDIDWTTEKSGLASDAAIFDYLGSVQSHRYWRLRAKRNDAGAANNMLIRDLRLISYQNLSTDATNPKNCHNNNGTQDNTSLATTGGAVTKELARWNFRATVTPAKVVVQHSEGIASSLIVLNLQKSTDGAVWTTIATYASTTSIVTETTILEDGQFQFLRLVVQDDRAGGSASQPALLYEMDAVFHTRWSGATSADRPLSGDKMRASEVSWVEADLVAHPGDLTPKSYGAPNLALITGEHYWFIYEAPSGASATSWWELDYATETNTHPPTQKSTDTGATWTQVAANAVLKFKVEFNNAQISATASDAASQTKYAPLVSGGKLAQSITDQSIASKEMAQRKANAFIARRKDVLDRIPDLISPLDLSADVGVRVTLDRDLALALGKSGTIDADVVEVHHDLAARSEDAGATTRRVLSEHSPDLEAALRLLGGLAGQRNLG